MTISEVVTVFIKFESDNREQVVECKSYLLFCDDWYPGNDESPQPCKYLNLDDSQTRWLLFDRVGNWRRAYIMNSDGQTIEKVYAPPLEQ